MNFLYRNSIIREIYRKAECLYHLIGKEPGFDIIKSVELLGGSVVFDENASLPVGVDARINTFREDNETRFVITCAQLKSLEEIRFCIAHELGHLFLHMTEMSADGTIKIRETCFEKNNNYSDIYEWQAEEFAASFLMPEEEFREYVKKEDGHIEQIAKIFKVPSQSVIVRSKRLEMF